MSSVSRHGILKGSTDATCLPNNAGSGPMKANVDVPGTVHWAGTYSDRPRSDRSDGAFIHGNRANRESLGRPDGYGTDIVFYYRGGLRDRTAERGDPTLQDAMICKKVDLLFAPFGEWSRDAVFKDDFE